MIGCLARKSFSAICGCWPLLKVDLASQPYCFTILSADFRSKSRSLFSPHGVDFDALCFLCYHGGSNSGAGCNWNLSPGGGKEYSHDVETTLGRSDWISQVQTKIVTWRKRDAWWWCLGCYEPSIGDLEFLACKIQGCGELDLGMWRELPWGLGRSASKTVGSKLSRPRWPSCFA